MKRQGKPDNFHPDQDEAPSRFRCWDGTMGCEQHKPETEFRWHTLICNQCVAATSARFGMKQTDFGFLSLLIFSDACLFREVVYEKAPSEKVDALKRGQEQQLRHLHEKIQMDDKGDPEKVQARMRKYRAWFRDTAFGRVSPVHVASDSALPTADRK